MQLFLQYGNIALCSMSLYATLKLQKKMSCCPVLMLNAVFGGCSVLCYERTLHSYIVVESSRALQKTASSNSFPIHLWPRPPSTVPALPASKPRRCGFSLSPSRLQASSASTTPAAPRPPSSPWTASRSAWRDSRCSWRGRRTPTAPTSLRPSRWLAGAAVAHRETQVRLRPVLPQEVHRARLNLHDLIIELFT